MSEGGLITAAQLGVQPRMERTVTSGQPDEAPSGAIDLASPLPEVEKRFILDALGRAKSNKSKAAKILGITRSQLYTRMKRFGLNG